jgi:hypothetical protein
VGAGSSGPLRGWSGTRTDTLADVLERVLDKGVVIVGDIVVNVLDVELLTLKLRLFIASADTAREMGLDWWTTDPFYSSKARAEQAEQVRGRPAESPRELRAENARLRARLRALELDAAADPQAAVPAREGAAADPAVQGDGAASPTGAASAS